MYLPNTLVPNTPSSIKKSSSLANGAMPSSPFTPQPPRTPIAMMGQQQTTTPSSAALKSPLRPPTHPTKSAVKPGPRSPPPLLASASAFPAMTPSFFTEKERRMFAFNLTLFIMFMYVLLFKTAIVSGWLGLKPSIVVMIVRAILVLHSFNILSLFITSLARFIRRSFTSSPPVLQQTHPTPKRGSVLKDAGSPRPSPLRTMAVAESTTTGSSALTSSASQTPLRSPFAKQHTTPLSVGSMSGSMPGSMLSVTPQQQLELQSAKSGSSQTTPKMLFTPSSKSINLRTPSALLTSPHSPFTVKTPVEQQQVKDSIRLPSSHASTPDTSGKEDRKEGTTTTTEATQKTPEKQQPQRRQLRGEECLRELSLQRDFEERIEGMRRWLWTMVIKPLVDDIDKVEAAFQANGMSHLGPLCPASMTLLNGSGTSGATVDLRPAFYVAPGVVSATSRPHTLMELAQTSRHDPMVQARLRIEKYLDVAAGVGQVSAGPRVALVRRLRAMAASPAALIPSTVDGDDALLLMHLFCTFLDERLPSSDLYSAQPFSSRHFYHPNQPIDPALSVAILQCSRTPPAFQVVTTDLIMTPLSTSPTHNCLHALVLFAAYVEKRLAGHLGIANLRSRSIQLFK